MPLNQRENTMTDEAFHALDDLSDDELLMRLGQATAGDSLVLPSPAALIRKGREALHEVRLMLQPAVCSAEVGKAGEALQNGSLNAILNGVVGGSQTFSLSKGVMMVVAVLVVRLGRGWLCEGYAPGPEAA